MARGATYVVKEIKMFSIARIAACAALVLGASAASAACTATYSTRDNWATGFVVDVTLKNSGNVPVSAWTLKWSYNNPVSQISSAWGGIVAVSGSSVTVSADPSQPAVAAGATLAAGLVLTYTSSTVPAAGTLQVSGQGCSTTKALYVDPQSTSAVWVRANPSDGRTSAISAAISSKSIARWFGDWSGDIRTAVSAQVDAATAAGSRAVLVAYNIPGRDCGQYSAGGSASAIAYQTWITGFAQGIGSRDAIVILEPDAIPQLDCLVAADQTSRLSLLNYATSQFKQLAPGALVYMDAGNSSWLTASVAAQRLQSAGIANAHGFSLNVSNYRTDSETVPYGQAVIGALKYAGLTKTFVVDTSRNGNGPLGTQWCDPAGRKIGVVPAITGNVDPEMNLWVKAPGESDGCAATAGTFVPDLAYKLIFGY